MNKLHHHEKGFFSNFANAPWRLVVVFSCIIVAVSVCSYALSQRVQQSKSVPALAEKTDFGQFPACTEAEGALAKMLAGNDKDIDLALANWLIVADLPQFADMSRDKYFALLNALIEQVRQEMARRHEMAESKGKNPSDPDIRCGIFCGSIAKLRLDYAEQFREPDLTPQQNIALHGDGNSIFLAGLLRTRRGTCISMPLIYLVIGQRLGMPVHLVALGKHYFIRWQEPGYRMNIETTIADRVAVTPDDSVYLEAEGLTREQLRGSDLRNLTHREVLGQLLFTRSGYWAVGTEKSLGRSLMDLSRAAHLAPDDTAIQKARQAIFSRYCVTPADTVDSLKQKERKSI